MKLLILLLCLAPAGSYALPFFKVTLDGKVSYILGTQHQPFRTEMIPREIFSYLSHAKTAYFESDPDMAHAWRYNVSQNRQVSNLKKLFTTEEWLRLKRALQTSGIPSEEFSLLSTSLAFAQAHTAFEVTDNILVLSKSKGTFARRPDLDKLAAEQLRVLQMVLNVDHSGNSPSNSYLDDILTLQAVRNPKTRVRYLDTEAGPAIRITEEELRKYIRLRLSRQRAIKFTLMPFFEKYVEEKLRQAPDERLYLSWRPGRSLHLYSAEPSSWLLPEALRAMQILERRHHDWWSFLLPGLKEGGAFIAVGAGHVIGDDSLLTTAEKHGAKVEFVDLPVPCEFLLNPKSSELRE